jgi:hypothetical protein
MTFFLYLCVFRDTPPLLGWPRTSVRFLCVCWRIEDFMNELAMGWDGDVASRMMQKFE